MADESARVGGSGDEYEGDSGSEVMSRSSSGAGGGSRMSRAARRREKNLSLSGAPLSNPPTIPPATTRAKSPIISTATSPIAPIIPEEEAPLEPSSPASTSSGKARPQSLLANNFASQLNDIFLINDTIDELSQSVESKRFSLTTRTVELSALEARLKLAEQLLEEKERKRREEEAAPKEGASGTTSELVVGQGRD